MVIGAGSKQQQLWQQLWQQQLWQQQLLYRASTWLDTALGSVKWFTVSSLRLLTAVYERPSPRCRKSTNQVGHHIHQSQSMCDDMSSVTTGTGRGCRWAGGGETEGHLSPLPDTPRVLARSLPVWVQFSLCGPVSELPGDYTTRDSENGMNSKWVNNSVNLHSLLCEVKPAIQLYNQPFLWRQPSLMLSNDSINDSMSVLLLSLYCGLECYGLPISKAVVLINKISN